MKKSFVTALAVALLGAMTLGAVASSASAPHKPAKNIVQTAVAAGRSRRSSRWSSRRASPAPSPGTGPLTVFAPTDAAFAKVPKATLAALAKDKAKLKRRPALPRGQGQAHGRAGRQAALGHDTRAASR